MHSEAAPAFRILARMSTSACMLLTTACAWHLGEPPTPSWRLAVVAPVAEPGVDDALRAALARAMPSSPTTGEAPQAQVRIVTASWEPSPLASDVAGGSLTWRAVLVVEVQVPEQGPPLATLRAERAVAARDAGGAVDARAAAFAALAAELAPAIAACLRGEG